MNEPENDKAGELNDGEQVNARKRHLSEVGIVRLILLGHEEKKEPVKKLQSIQRVDPHVEKDTIEDRHGDLLQNWRKKRGETDKNEDGDVGDSLLSGSKELNLLPRRTALRLNLE